MCTGVGKVSCVTGDRVSCVYGGGRVSCVYRSREGELCYGRQGELCTGGGRVSCVYMRWEGKLCVQEWGGGELCLQERG